MASFTIAGSEYESKLFDGETQVLIAKRLSGVMFILAGVATPVINAVSKMSSVKDAAIEDVAFILQPAAQEIARMSDDDVTFIMNACMGVTRRRIRIGVGWAPVFQNGVMQDDADSTFLVRLSITWYVLQENFFQIAELLGLTSVTDRKTIAADA